MPIGSVSKRPGKLKIAIGAIFILFLANVYTFDGFSFRFPKLILASAQAAGNILNASLAWPHEKSDLSPDANVHYGQLKNGFRYVLMENANPKNRVSMHLNIMAGSMHETEEQRGLAHLLEHMVFNGSTHFKPGELVKYFQNIGMQFGGDANAHTGFYETVYDILLPSGDEETLGKGLLVLEDYAHGALLLESEIKRERQVVLAEKRSRDSASYRTFEATFKFELPQARLSKRLPIGKESVVRNASRAGLKDYYDTWYRPQNMILIVVGQFDRKLVEKLINDRFSTLTDKASGRPQPRFGIISHQGLESFYHYEKELGNTSVSIEVLRKISPLADSEALQKALLAQRLANAIMQNRLDLMVSKPGTPFTSADISAGIYLQQMRYAEISADCSPEKWDSSLSLVEKVLRQGIRYGFTKNELQRVKNDYLAALDRAVKAASTRKSTALAREIIQNLNRNRVFMSPLQKQSLFAPMVAAMTIADINAAFANSWRDEHRLLLVSGNALIDKSKNKAEERIKAVVQRSRQTAVKKPVEEKTVHFPYLPPPSGKGRILKRRLLQALNITQIDFENGMRLNLKPTQYKANEVLATLIFGKGRSEQPLSMPGLAALSSRVINESGLGKLDKDQLERALSGKNTHVNFSIREDHFSLHAKSVPAEIPLMFQLLHAHLVDPGRRETAFALVSERFRQQYLSMEKTVDGAMTLHGKRFLAGGDSRFGLPSKDKFESLTLENIRDWIGDAMQNYPVELSVVGDFDIETVVENAARYLGTLPVKPFSFTFDPVMGPRFVQNDELVVEVPSKIRKALVVVAYPSDDLWDISKTRRLSILSDIFSDRLREEIREKLGVAYSPVAFNIPSRAYAGYGVLQAHIEIAPDFVHKVVDEIRHIGTEMANHGVAKEALTRALKPTLTGIKDLRQRNEYWLNTVLSGSRRYPQQLQWSLTMESDYAAISKTEIDQLAATYLQPSKSTAIIVLPKAASAISSGNQEK